MNLDIALMDVFVVQFYQDLIGSDTIEDFEDVVRRFREAIQAKTKTQSPSGVGLVEKEFLDEVRCMLDSDKVSIFFGKSLRDIKLILVDDVLRQHELFVAYKEREKLVVTQVNVPFTPLQEREYKSLEELCSIFMKHFNDLHNYFNELDRIDRLCTVMEPVKPTLKDDFRRILIDDRTWLHVEVTPLGQATNIHLVGQFASLNDKLQSGLLAWDPDKDTVENILNIFDLTNFPVDKANKSSQGPNTMDNAEEHVCGICLCSNLSDRPGILKPFCSNLACEMRFHRDCLYEWLVACTSQVPAFGVVSGSCPSCGENVRCSKND